MAIWGIGAYYKGAINEDKTDEFINNGYAYIGWNEKEAPALYRMFDSIKIGDIIFIQAFVPRSKKLTIKALGIVTDTKKQINGLGTGIKVAWKKDFKSFSTVATQEIYRNNVFNNTLYEEFNESISKRIIDALL